MKVLNGISKFIISIWSLSLAALAVLVSLQLIGFFPILLLLSAFAHGNTNLLHAVMHISVVLRYVGTAYLIAWILVALGVNALHQQTLPITKRAGIIAGIFLTIFTVQTTFGDFRTDYQDLAGGSLDRHGLTLSQQIDQCLPEVKPKNSACKKIADDLAARQRSLHVQVAPPSPSDARKTIQHLFDQFPTHSSIAIGTPEKRNQYPGEFQAYNNLNAVYINRLTSYYGAPMTMTGVSSWAKPFLSNKYISPYSVVGFNLGTQKVTDIVSVTPQQKLASSPQQRARFATTFHWKFAPNLLGRLLLNSHYTPIAPLSIKFLSTNGGLYSPYSGFSQEATDHPQLATIYLEVSGQNAQDPKGNPSMINAWDANFDRYAEGE